METTRPPARLVDATRFFSRGDSKRPPATESTLRNEMSALYGSILPMIDERGSAVLHVTAAGTGEGVTTIAFGLAAAAVRREARVLYAVLDAETAIPMNGVRAGALEQFAQTGSIQPESRLFDGVSIPCCSLVGAGGESPKPQDVRAFYEWARQKYALVVVDCPPVLGPSDTAALCRVADGALLVVSADDARVQVVTRARDTLDAAGANIVGVVLNRRQNFIPRQLYRFL